MVLVEYVLSKFRQFLSLVLNLSRRFIHRLLAFEMIILEFHLELLLLLDCFALLFLTFSLSTFKRKSHSPICSDIFQGQRLRFIKVTVVCDLMFSELSLRVERGGRKFVTLSHG